jgi:uncharacterized protein (DUF488 family)
MRNDASPRLFSIGHSHHELVDLVRLLQAAAVTAVADVRSSPFSQRQPQFNRPELADGLKRHGIAYWFLGDLLGGRPQQPSLYDADGRVDFERVRATPWFRQGLERLIQGLDQFTLAMLCAEEDPLDCHRGLMIAPALKEQGIAPVHLRGNGLIETTADLETRLLAETKVGEGILDGLFAAMVSAEERGQLLAEAYRRMARRKAFRRRPEGWTDLPDEDTGAG